MDIDRFDRRDFLKLKILMFVYAFFNNTFANSMLKKSNEFAILDRLLNLPLSPLIKQEVVLRVELQKKYGFNQNGKLHPFDRFFKEIISFIVYHGELGDLALCMSVIKKHHDYVIVQAAKYNSIATLEYSIKKLIGYDRVKSLSSAFLSAIYSNSYETTAYLSKLDITLSDSEKDKIREFFSNEDNTRFKQKVLGTKLYRLPFRTDSTKTVAKSLPSCSFKGFCLEDLYIWLEELRSRSSNRWILDIIGDKLDEISSYIISLFDSVLQKMVKNGELVDFDIRMRDKHIQIIFFITDNDDKKQILNNFQKYTLEYDSDISHVLDQVDIVNVDFVVV